MVSPEILSVGCLQLRWYGVCVSLGVIVGYWLMCARAKKYDLNASQCADLIFVGMIFGLIGARAEYVRREWVSLFRDDLLGIFRIWEGGISFQGGLILAAIAICIMCHIRNWKIVDVADLMTPALAAGHAFGRIGCLLNGCCYGNEYHGIFAVQYDFLREPVFPVQAVEALFCLLILAVLLYVEYREKAGGRLFPIYLIVYSVGRFFIEYLRGDYLMASDVALTPAQSLFLYVGLPCGVVSYILAEIWQWRKNGTKKTKSQRR